ncbi:MAG: glutaredoxin domain-containing protein [Pseudomonadota bacterium]
MKVELYTRPLCGFCDAAKRLLDQKRIAYVTYDIWEDSQHLDAMKRRNPGARTVPQIFINDHAIGGYDDLQGLDLDDQTALEKAFAPA